MLSKSYTFTITSLSAENDENFAHFIRSILPTTLTAKIPTHQNDLQSIFSIHPINFTSAHVKFNTSRLNVLQSYYINNSNITLYTFHIISSQTLILFVQSHNTLLLHTSYISTFSILTNEFTPNLPPNTFTLPTVHLSS